NLYFYLVSHDIDVSYLLFTAPPTTELYTLSLHDALPISRIRVGIAGRPAGELGRVHRAEVDGVVRVEPEAGQREAGVDAAGPDRSEEHTSELQSRENLVCRLLLEKKNKKIYDKVIH